MSAVLNFQVCKALLKKMRRAQNPDFLDADEKEAQGMKQDWALVYLGWMDILKHTRLRRKPRARHLPIRGFLLLQREYLENASN